MALLTLAISLAGCAPGATNGSPAVLEHRSELGFLAMIPSDWIVVDRAAIRAQPNLVESDQSFWAETGFPESTIEQIMTLIETGNVEFYYPRPPIAIGFAENINVSKVVSVVPHNKAEATVTCSTLEDEYRVAISPAVSVDVCMMRPLASGDVFYVESSGAFAAVKTVQYFVRLAHGAVIVVTLSTTAEGVPHRQAAMDALVSSIKPR